jgi:hypothetical protein
LFLRPTESSTLFLQQLGRGLRKLDDNKVTTVLDFIGNARTEFRFDRRFRALLRDGTPLTEQIARGFPWLPPGCAIALEPKARDIVLSNVRRALENRPGAIGELRELAKRADGKPSLAHFLGAMQWQPEQLYRRRGRDWTYSGFCQDADVFAEEELDGKIVNSVANLLHVDDRLRLQTWSRWLSKARAPRTSQFGARDRRLMIMLFAVLFNKELKSITTLDEGTARLWRNPRLRDELHQLFAILAERQEHVDGESGLWESVPLRLHASYQRDEILAACGELTMGQFPNRQIGISRTKHERLILNFVTITEGREYSPKNQYRDFAISPTHFQSETTNNIGPHTGFGRELVELRRPSKDESKRNVPLLFVRPHEDDPRGLTMPYVFLGPTKLIECRGDRPMQLTWELTTPIPAWFYPQACLTT